MDTFSITDNSILSIESGSDGSEFDDFSSSQSDCSLPSESNCFSYHTDEPSTTNNSLAKSKKSVNLLQKLYYREIRGDFSPHPRAPNCRLFNSVPAANKICLHQVLPKSAFISNHVFLGLSKCGQFLLSYTHSIELDVIIFNNVHKYRLHWWSFVPRQRARKVAEVMLFGNQGVYCDLHISVCQWPIDTTKLLIYGYCVHTDHCQFGHSHLTITTVPSLNTCRDCLKVAASYEEDDLAAIWDSCVRFSCLKHGLTIHSNFDVVSPYPKFNPQISMKRDGVVLFNTGNFLHVLRADLESFGGGGNAKTSAQEGGRYDSGCKEAGSTQKDESRLRHQTPPPFKNLASESDLRVENPVNFLGEFLENCNNSRSGVPDESPRPEPNASPQNKDCVIRIDRLKQEIEEGKLEGQKLAEEANYESRRFWSTLEEMKNSLNPSLSVETSSDSLEAFQSVETCKTVQGSVVDAPINECDRTCAFEDVESLVTGPDCNTTACLGERREYLQMGAKRDALTQRERAVRDFQNEVFSGRRRATAKTKQLENKEDLDVPVRIEKIISSSDEIGKRKLKCGRTDFDSDEETERNQSGDDKHIYVTSNASKDFQPQSIVNSQKSDVSKADIMEEVYVMSRMFDSSMELNITCSNVEEPSKATVKSTRSLLMVSDATDERRKLEHATSNNADTQRKLRKPRGGLVKIGSATPPVTPPKIVAAETVYEFTDDQPDNSEKLSSFRRRRLAEKKYEFCEEGEDAENIVPFRLLRNREVSPRLRSPPALPNRKRIHEDHAVDSTVTGPKSPGVEVQGATEQDKAVLRPLNRNLVAITLLSPREAERDWQKPSLRKVPLIEATNDGCLTEMGYQKGGRDDAVPPGQGLHNRAKCTIQFKRHYIEVDDELVSTTTDIEDDDCTGSAPYHFALPLEIHGAGYVQLQMISNSKADKLMGAPGVVVHQMSFDVEAFCHEMAQRLCEAAGKKYCFCVDYDVEIVDVCIITGDVLVLAIMRIEAIIMSKGLAKSLRRGEILVSGQRNQYQGGCTFVWDTHTGAHRIVSTSPLCESSAMDDTLEPWGPAKSHVQTLRKTLPQVPMRHAVRSISNRPVITEESYKCLSDLDNLIDLVL